MTTGPSLRALQCAFPRGTLIVPGKGVHREVEMWLLPRPDEQKRNDWNYWIGMIRVLPEDRWEISVVVPWWGRYGWYDTEPGATRGVVTSPGEAMWSEPLPDIDEETHTASDSSP